MMKNLASWVIAVVATAGAAAAQPAPAQPPAAAGTYRIGPADVLQITVFDEPGLSSKFTVDTDGTITYPFLGRLEVRGKTLREVEEILTTRLRADYVKNAQVTVEIDAFRSRSIFVIGEVKAPAKYIIEGPVTLLEVIARAGSFTPTAGPTIIVQRYKDGLTAAATAAPAQPGSEQTAELLRVDIDDLKQGKVNANVLLQDGDTIIVNPADRFYVTGFVRTPGGYVLRRGMTVEQAIAEAGGLNERGSSRGIKIQRKVNGKEVEIDARMTDPVLPNDTIKIRQRRI
jgi:polysaccharide export outer membrane protein